jgi:hypothetical protein
MDLLRREERKAFLKIEAHLMAEDRARPGAGAIRAILSLFEGAAEEIEVGLHPLALTRSRATAHLHLELGFSTVELAFVFD